MLFVCGAMHITLQGFMVIVHLAVGLLVVVVRWFPSCKCTLYKVLQNEICNVQSVAICVACIQCALSQCTLCNVQCALCHVQYVPTMHTDSLAWGVQCAKYDNAHIYRGA